MATYTRPGVYIEEYLQPLSDISADPADSSAAFVGTSSAGGPVGPIYVSSWPQYQALFGGLATVTDDLSYAVYSYFNNGGRGAWITRALRSDATAATLTLSDGAGTPTNVLTFTAGAPGVWASGATSPSRVYLSVRPGATGSNRFDIIVEVGTGNYLAAQEQFVDLSMDPADPRYAVDLISSPVVGSKYVTVATAAAYTWNPTTPKVPAVASKVPLTGGTDGSAAVDLVATTQKLDSVDRNLVINVPGASSTDLTNIVTWAESTGRHFVVADVPKPAVGETAIGSVTAMAAFAAALPKSSSVAIYGPWYFGNDPGSRAGALRLTAPGGAVVGQFLRTDASRGVFKAPAGVQNVLSGAQMPYQNYSNTQLDSIATAQVNVIKTIPGSGVTIWGARTQASGTPDRYVPVRRLLISLKAALYARTRFAVFEVNNEDLRATVTDVVQTYLNTQYDLGAFKGSSPAEAFYVRCDDTNNTAQTADAGLLNIEVGVALASPAEFVVIRLGQTQAQATVSDDLEDV